jgi:uncharacterized protein YcfJ
LAKSVMTMFMGLALLAPAVSHAQHEGQMFGTLLGGAAGGLIGNQFGKGSGNVGATIGGVALGAIIGNLIGREIDRPAAARMPEIQYDRLRHENYRHHAGDVFVHVYYNREVYPIRGGFTECMEYDVYARIDGRRGHTQTRYACSTGNGWVEVSRHDVSINSPQPSTPYANPYGNPNPYAYPAPQPLPPPVVLFTQDEMVTMAHALNRLDYEADRLVELDRHVRYYGNSGRSLNCEQEAYLRGFFRQRMGDAIAIMAPYLRMRCGYP